MALLRECRELLRRLVTPLELLRLRVVECYPCAARCLHFTAVRLAPGPLHPCTIATTMHAMMRMTRYWTMCSARCGHWLLTRVFFHASAVLFRGSDRGTQQAMNVTAPVRQTHQHQRKATAGGGPCVAVCTPPIQCPCRLRRRLPLVRAMTAVILLR